MKEHSHKIRITAAPFHFYIQDVHTVVENLAVAAPHRALTAPLKSNIADSSGGVSLSAKSLPALAFPTLLTFATKGSICVIWEKSSLFAHL